MGHIAIRGTTFGIMTDDSRVQKLHVRNGAWFEVNLDSFFPKDVDIRKTELFYGQLTATLNSLCAKRPFALFLNIRTTIRWHLALPLLV
jgi:hypothetical protein